LSSRPCCCSASLSSELYRSMSSSTARRRLLGPRAGGWCAADAVRFTMRFLGGPLWSPVAVGGVVASVLRERRRSLSGDGACASGGVGRFACDDAGGVMGSWAAVRGGAGLVRRDWRERHVEKMLPMAVCVESWGGLAGGEAKSADWRRVKGGVCDESHGSADGSNIVVRVLLRDLSTIRKGQSIIGVIARRDPRAIVGRAKRVLLAGPLCAAGNGWFAIGSGMRRWLRTWLGNSG